MPGLSAKHLHICSAALLVRLTRDIPRWVGPSLTRGNRNVGFLRYWTVPNLPLFLLAAPMLVILAKSGMEQLRGRRLPTADNSAESARLLSFVRSAAAAQVVLAVLAATTYHVQIIARISSGYPVWYWWLAGSLIRGEKSGSRIVMFMVMYASIQGALFASFLPPA